MSLLRLLALLILLPLPLAAQTQIELGGVRANPDAEVEIAADSLSVDQSSGEAVFSGNVTVGQGDLRLGAGQITVVYDRTSGQIARLRASGGVTLVTATEAAEAATADYDLITGVLTLAGDVLLTQGQSALSADSMLVNLRDGTARMEGRVRTVFRQAE